jgi:hypothetical protein
VMATALQCGVKATLRPGWKSRLAESKPCRLDKVKKVIPSGISYGKRILPKLQVQMGQNEICSRGEV